MARRSKSIVVALIAAHVIGGAAIAVLGSSQAALASPSIRPYHRICYELFPYVSLSQAGLLGIWLGLSRTTITKRVSYAALGLIYVQGLILSFFLDDVGLRVVVAAVLLIPLLVVAMLMRVIRWRGWELELTNHHLPEGPGLKFSTRHLLILTSFIALLFAMKQSGGGRAFLSVEFAAFLLCEVCIFVGGVWASLALGNAKPRIAILFLVAFLLGTVFLDYPISARQVFLETPLFGVQTAVVAGSLLMIRALGYRLIASRNDRSCIVSQSCDRAQEG